MICKLLSQPNCIALVSSFVETPSSSSDKTSKRVTIRFAIFVAQCQRKDRKVHSSGEFAERVIPVIRRGDLRRRACARTCLEVWNLYI